MSRDEFLPPSLGGAESEGTSEVSTESIVNKVLGEPATLAVLSGPATGAEIDLRALPIIIGRAEPADIAIEDSGISKQHLMVSRQGGRLWVQDMGSSNGTLVNGKRVQRAPVQPGDTVAAGATLMRFMAARWDLDPAESEPVDTPGLRDNRRRSETMAGLDDDQDDDVIELVDRVDDGAES